jgi:hypothetical protein
MQKFAVKMRDKGTGRGVMEKSANKKGRDLSQNLSLGVESLLDPSHCYYSYFKNHLKNSPLGKRL